jgi:hypothetical protein
VHRALPDILRANTHVLSLRMAGLAPVERAIENVSTEIEALAEQDDSCQRLTAFSAGASKPRGKTLTSVPLSLVTPCSELTRDRAKRDCEERCSDHVECRDGSDRQIAPASSKDARAIGQKGFLSMLSLDQRQGRSAGDVEELPSTRTSRPERRRSPRSARATPAYDAI